MGQEVAHAERQEIMPPVRSDSSSLLTQIVEASRDPTVDADKMQAMANLAIQLQDREMQQQFNRDLSAAIADMPVITKAGRIVILDKVTKQVIQSTPYEKFEDLDRVVKPIARRHHLSYNFDCGGDSQRLLVTVILRHDNGYVERSSPMPLPLETSGSKNNVQGAGSTNTYGKRYALKNVFAISVEGEDDDGNLGQTAALPHERAEVVMDDARAAHAEGRYDEWFRAQSPRDRGYLVTSGKHAEFGGEPALPPPGSDVRVMERGPGTATAKQKPDKPPQDQRPSEDDEEAARAQAREKWVGTYCGKVEACASLDAYAILQDEQKANLERFRADYPDLWSRISDAHSRAYDRLSSDTSGEPGGTLFDGEA